MCHPTCDMEVACSIVILIEVIALCYIKMVFETSDIQNQDCLVLESLMPVEFIFLTLVTWRMSLLPALSVLSGVTQVGGGEVGSGHS